MDLTRITSATTPFADYQPGAAPRYDEFLGPDGQPRPAWSVIARGLDRLGNEGLKGRAAEAEHMVQDSDANFRVVSDHQARPWNLAIVPLVLDQANWTQVEAGTQQRVRLLEAVLADFLGPQRLLRERVLPAELLSANPEFSRSYHDLPVSGKRLTLTATDLARSDDGTWWVTGDRTPCAHRSAPTSSA